MRQKYLISQDDSTHHLTIKEYAVVDKEVKKKSLPIVQEDNFSFLCQEVYDEEIVVRSIAEGPEALTRTIRTNNLFPTSEQMHKIIASVTALYEDKDGNQSIELLFDDADLLVTNTEEA